MGAKKIEILKCLVFKSVSAFHRSHRLKEVSADWLLAAEQNKIGYGKRF